WCLLAYVATAAGLLLKGPVAVVLPGAVAGLFLAAAWRGSESQTYRLLRTLLWGIPLVALLVLPWYWWVGVRTGGAWHRSFFWYHNVERALGSGGLRSHPWW